MRAPVNAAVINGKVSTAGAVTSPLLSSPLPIGGVSAIFGNSVRGSRVLSKLVG